MARVAIAAIALGCWLCAALGQAKLCGDDVAGQRVPCACGDTVVSDLSLTDDPVARTTCPNDGLIVRAMDATHGVTVDLRGKTLRGKGNGAGIWILYGGPGGARLVSAGGPGHIEGFRDGLVAQGSDSVVLIKDVIARRNSRDGVRVQASGYTIRDSATKDSGRDGFSLGGHQFHIAATQAVNSVRFGYLVTGHDGEIGAPGAGPSSQGSGMAAFNLTGHGHRLIDCAAAGAGKAGIHLNGSHYTVSGCVAQDSTCDGITGAGIDWRFSRNRALNNGDDGLVVHGMNVVDLGGNSGSGNRGQHPHERQHRHQPAQCEINSAPCTQ
jgi:hypothetical protein